MLIIGLFAAVQNVSKHEGPGLAIEVQVLFSPVLLVPVVQVAESLYLKAKRPEAALAMYRWGAGLPGPCMGGRLRALTGVRVSVRG